MKSVTLVAFIGSWFCSSLTSRLRKSADVIAPLEEELDDDVEDVPVDEVIEETVMANSGSAHRGASRGRIERWCDRDLVCQSNGRRADFRRRFISRNSLIRRH